MKPSTMKSVASAMGRSSNSINMMKKNNGPVNIITNKRMFSTSNSTQSSSSGIVSAIAIATVAAGAGYYFKDDIKSKIMMKDAPASAKALMSVQDMQAIVQMTAREVQAASAKSDAGKTPSVDYNAVRKAIADILEDASHDDGSYGPLFVRLAWHASGTYDKNTGRGGSDGATMRFAGEADWGANAGLHVARSKLEPIKAKFPGLTYADLWILAGSVAIEEMGGPKINFRSGRHDALGSTNLPDGLLPDADGRDKKANPADHLRDIFYRQGFNDQEIVALSGAHALGRCHPNVSGFWGPWTRAPTTFSNEYFKLILNEEWKEKKTHQGKPWTGPFQYEDKTGELMMLPTDLALAQDPKMRVWVEKYAKDEKLFFDDFAKAWIKLTENGVRRFHGTRRYYFFGPRE